MALARPTFIRPVGTTATLQAAFVRNRVGNASGGNMSAGRFTTGPTSPPRGTGRVVKR
jgi:hypothetical protein